MNGKRRSDLVKAIREDRWHDSGVCTAPTPAVENPTSSQFRDLDADALLVHLLGEQHLGLVDVVGLGQVDEILDVGQPLHLVLVLEQDRDARAAELGEEQPDLEDHVLSRSVLSLVGLHAHVALVIGRERGRSSDLWDVHGSARLLPLDTRSCRACSVPRAAAR